MAAPTMDVEVRAGLPNKGRGLFTLRDFAAGEVLFEEKPLVCCQFLWNYLYSYTACDHCMKSLETAEAMCRRLSGHTSVVLPFPENCGVTPEQHVRCPECQVLYCSSACRDEAWQTYHKTICLGPSPGPGHPLIRLQEAWRNIHYPPETASIMLVVRMIATVRQAADKQVAVAAFNKFCQSTVNEEEEIAHKLLGSQFAGQLDMLRLLVAEALYEEELEQWFTPEGFRSLFAMIGTNGQGVGTSSLSVWVHACDALHLPVEGRKQLDEFIDQLYVDIEKVTGNFLNCDGSGLYTLQSSCNHSCVANTEVTFPHNNSMLAVCALQDIKAGEEVCISYLDECQLHSSRHSRQKALRENYLFNCLCPKCIAQADDPDITSEEEEDDDMDADEDN